MAKTGQGDSSVVSRIRQSPPIDTASYYSPAWVKGKTFIITGGASGFGEGFARAWAASGACVIIGDINVSKGHLVASDIRKQTKNDRVHFVYVNVTEWKSQVNFFKEACKLSPHGGIDTVVANAGIAPTNTYELPQGLDGADPPPPDLKTMDVNLTGVLYTAHLALFYLERNPGSKPSDPSNEPSKTPRDRHLLLVGSMASLEPFPSMTLYVTSKHAVLGLFRNLRSTSFVHGVRVNMLCPCFIDTPILPTAARLMLAGSGIGKPEDVVAAATRFAADTRIVGRSLAVGPRMNINQDDQGDWQLVPKPGGRETAIWEAYAHDFEQSDVFTRRFTRIMEAFTLLRGWHGYFRDVVKAILYAVRRAIGH